MAFWVFAWLLYGVLGFRIMERKWPQSSLFWVFLGPILLVLLLVERLLERKNRNAGG